MAAEEGDHESLARCLVLSWTQGASINAMDFMDWQPIQYAAYGGRVALVQLLIKAKGTYVLWRGCMSLVVVL